jgi:hypothetical protein
MMSSNGDLEPVRAASFDQRLEWALLDLLDTLADIAVSIEARSVRESQDEGCGQGTENAKRAGTIVVAAILQSGSRHVRVPVRYRWRIRS